MNKLYISMYHYTRDLIHSRYPNIKGLDVSLFRKQIEYFVNNFNVVTMEQVIDCVKNQSILPDKALLLTFDDGYIDNYTYAFPILSDYKIQGSFFIPGKTFTTHQLLDVNKIHYVLASANINDLLKDLLEQMNYYRDNNYESNEVLFNKYAVANRFDHKEIIFVKRMLQTVLPEKTRNIISSNLFKKYVGISEEKLSYELYMTKEQIKVLKDNGMYIGVHGYDHYWLANLPYDEMKNDINLALKSLEGFIDNDFWVINYPYGNYNNEVIDYAKTKGACIGLTTNVGIVNLDEDDPMKLSRFDCNDFPPKSNNYLEK